MARAWAKWLRVAYRSSSRSACFPSRFRDIVQKERATARGPEPSLLEGHPGPPESDLMGLKSVR